MMIEISHKQAQYLIRQAGDRPLPDEQWAALEDHLAHCADCRAFRDQRARLEHRARRLLLLRWQELSPGPGIAEALLATRRDHGERRLSVLAWAGMMVLLLFVALASRSGKPLNPLLTARPTGAQMKIYTLTTVSTLTPRPPNLFHGVAAFQASPDGNAEIYLLNAGPAGTELANLTQNPAEDIDPTWSPDGEWLAFISDRSGKPEVYVISIAGTRLTQLTHDPGMTWSGPLAWSQDGRWLALIGLRDHQGNDAWVYLIPMSGIAGDTSPRRLPGTHNVTGPLRFYTLDAHHQYLASSVPPGKEADFNTYLVYSIPGTIVLMRYDLQLGRSAALNFVEPRVSSEHNTLAAGFAYTVSNQMDTTFYLTEVTTPTQQADTALSRVVMDARTGETWLTQIVLTQLGRIRAVSDLPADPRIAYLADSDGTGCYQINLYRDSYPAIISLALRRIPDICVDGGLDSAQWQSDARWVVVWGHEPLNAQPALYALEVGLGDSGTPILQRLTPMEKGSGDPRVRPEGIPSLGLNPQPAAALQPITAGYDIPIALLKAVEAVGPRLPVTLTQPAATSTPAARPNPQLKAQPAGTLPGRTIQKLSPR